MKSHFVADKPMLVALLLFLVASGLCQDCTTWYENTKHSPAAYRNVKTYGAKGDGVTDDTAAIQAALTQGRNPNPSTHDPTVVYLPAGTYLVHDTLPLYFYTHLIGNFKCRPTIVLAPNSPGFNGRKYVLEATFGDSEHVSNFYHQIHNVDVTISDGNPGAVGIHWSVAQATSLRNMTINVGSGDMGYFNENGGGGFIGDVTILGGNTGMMIGGQQWTIRGLTVSGARNVAVDIIWNWVFTFLDLDISNTPVGVQLKGTAAGTASLLDSTFTNVYYCVDTDFPLPLEGVLLDRFTAVNATYITAALQGNPGGTVFVPSWRQGYYSDGNNTFGQLTVDSLTVGTGGALFRGPITAGTNTGRCTTGLLDGLVFQLSGVTGRDVSTSSVAIAQNGAVCGGTVGGVAGVCTLSGTTGMAINGTQIAQYFPLTRAARSVCGWGYLTGGSGNRWIFSYGSLAQDNVMHIGAAGNSGAAGGYQNDFVSMTWVLNTWNHICLTFDGITASYYWNANLALSGTKPYSIPSSPAGAYIGSEVNGAEPWQGAVYDVRVYRRALTGTDVRTLFDATRSDSLGACTYVPSGASLLNGATVVTDSLTTGSSSTTTISGNLVVSAPSVYSAAAKFDSAVTVNNVLEVSSHLDLGYNVAGRDPSAGKIGYGKFTANMLDIVGAGTTAGSRSIKMWDNVVVTGALSVGPSVTFGDGSVQTTAFTLTNLLSMMCSATRPFVSCLAVFMNNCPSGVYNIDVDGPGATAAFQAHCNNDVYGGGWTLALKVDGGVNTFQYDSNLWSTNNVLNPGSADFDTNQAKLNTYNVLPFREILLGFRSCRTSACAIASWSVVLGFGTHAGSLLGVIGPGGTTGTGLGRTAWMNMLPGSALEANCNQEGLNRICGGGGYSRVRIGIMGNNEGDCVTCDTWIGVGGQNTPCGGDPNMSAGNLAACSGNALVNVNGQAVGNNNYAAFAYVYVR